MINSALRYASIGWHVFPCNNKTKQPLTQNGFHDATTSITQINHWWSKHPEALIGVACGKSMLCVIDLDKKDNRNGFITWDSIKKEDVATVEQITQSGGRQLIFKANDEKKIKQGNDTNGYNGIDTRNHGGYFIVAPSKMADGNTYEWLSDQSPFELAPAEIPDWVYELFKEETKGTRKKFEIPEKLEKGNRGVTIFKMACSLKSRNDLDFNQVLSSVRAYNKEHCNPPLEESELIHHVESAFSYENVPLEIVEGLEELSESVSTTLKFVEENRVKLVSPKNLKWNIKEVGKGDNKKKVLIPSFNNVLNILKSSKELFDVYRYNEFSHDINIVKYHKWMGVSYPGKSVDDNDLIALKTQICKRFGLQPTVAIINEALTQHAIDNSYHPVKTFLNNLSWDGKKRMDSWLIDYCGADDNAYTRAVGRLILTAACSRIDRPGCKFDYMLILEGDQGIGKSQAVNVLGGEWFSEINIMARDKDTIEKMRGKWIIEVPELVSFKKQDIESLKSFISTQVDRVRPAYARKSMDFPRQCVFICTINPDQAGYLKDATGNRRFFPVRLAQVDLKSLQRDRDQLFAEAWKSAKNRPKLYIDDSGILKEATREQGDREYVDERISTVKDYLDEHAEIKEIRGVDLYIKTIDENISKYDRKSQNILGGIMRKLGWENKPVRKDGILTKMYVRPESDVFSQNLDKIEWDS